ncbi:hypothetical protein [Micromonospora rhizosphaerae]|nr:hypothetical protein [Micromonospora rhizosphaerae]
MIRLTMRRATLSATAAANASELVNRLSKLGNPFLKTGLDAQRAILKSKRLVEFEGEGESRYSPTIRQIAWGEIFIANGELYLVAEEINSGGRRFFYLGAVTDGTPSELLEEFTKEIESALKIELKPFWYTTGEFDELKEKVQEGFEKPLDDEIAMANSLTDRDLRSLAIAIKQSGGLLVSDLAKQLKSAPRADVGAIRAQMDEAGLLVTETVVMCRSTSRQAFRVPSSQAITSLSAQGVRCGCGRPIDEERQEDAVSLTDGAIKLLDKSRWLSIIVHKELIAAGVEPDRILIEAMLEGDEVDCVADIGGELTLFELKDKEFSLGEAYSFGAKIGIIDPAHGVIVTTARVGADARQHLNRALQYRDVGRPRRHPGAPGPRDARFNIVYVEGVGNLGDEIRKFVSGIAKRDAMNFADRVIRSRRISASDIVKSVQPAVPRQAVRDTSVG